jgi:glycosyltransferase involved in cell wall biosynthesis
MSKLKLAILIPLYNSEETILDVIKKCQQFSNNIVVVNDGSTDRSGELLAKISDEITLITHSSNRGKGGSLRAGFSYLIEHNFTHALTIDSDGEHSPEDIPTFLEKMEESPQKLWIGARVLTKTRCKVSLIIKIVRHICNFWIKIYTGHSLKDSRSGFRLYPLSDLKKRIFTRVGFDFEQEVLLKLAWNGTEIDEFDIFDINVRNKTLLDLRSLSELYQLLSLNIGAFFHRFINPFAGSEIPGDTILEKFKNSIDKELKSNLSPFSAAASISIGAFFGLLPIYGFQVFALLFFATLIKLNRPIAFLGSNVSFPPFWPIIFPVAAKIGSVVLGRSDEVVSVGGKIVSGFFQFVVGSLILAPSVALLVFLISYPIFSSIQKSK